MKLKTLLEAADRDDIATRLAAVRAALKDLPLNGEMTRGDADFYDTPDDKLKVTVRHTGGMVDVSLAYETRRGVWHAVGDMVGDPRYAEILDRYGLGGSSARYDGDVFTADVEKFAKKLAAAFGAKKKKVREAADRYADVDRRNPALPDVFELKHGGRTYHVRMSPWMWMYPWKAEEHMGFSVALTPNAPNAAAHFFQDVPAPKGYLGAKKADIVKTVTAWLKGGGDAELEKAAGSWAKVRGDFQAAMAKADDKNARQDAKQKKAGMTHRVDAVVHPKSGGSDQAISWYVSAKPTAAAIKAELKKRGSIDPSDYKVVAL